jgi:serine phosphatase RsbU (regulator of sigma subunit)/anti-sigma regulatory factor (Ser/Thr protein kinase)
MEQLASSLGRAMASHDQMLPTGDPALIVPARTHTHAHHLPEGHTGRGPRWGLDAVPGSRGLSFMYQAYKLPVAFSRASGTADVLLAAREHIAQPFAADGFLTAVAAEDGRLTVLASSPHLSDLAEVTHGEEPDQDLPGIRAAQGGLPLLLPDPQAVRRSYPGSEVGPLGALAVLPLAAGNTRGCLMLAFREPRVLDSDEQALLLMMTAQFSAALDRARLNEAQRALGEALQRRLLPRDLPELPALTTVARYLSAPHSSQMGGDWYDVVALPDGGIVLVVGDVEGHSTDSAAVMGQLRSALRAYAAEGHAPCDVLARSSAMLAELESDLHATCCLVRIDAEFGTAEIALAGHPPPLVRYPNGATAPPRTMPNLPLAVRPGTAYYSTEVAVTPGTLIMLYTNGLFAQGVDDIEDEARDCLARLDPGASQASLHEAADRLVAAAVTKAAHRRRDDAALLLARYEGNPQATTPRMGHMSVVRHDLRSVGRVRRFVRTFLQEGGLDGMAGDLEVMVSELATNALVHADSAVEVSVREYRDRIHLEVRDTDIRPPVPAPVMGDEVTNATAEHGRGLNIVDALSTSWGTSPNGRGKSVWVDLLKTPDEDLLQ